jgi:hypothetical protein
VTIWQHIFRYSHACVAALECPSISCHKTGAASIGIKSGASPNLADAQKAGMNTYALHDNCRFAAWSQAGLDVESAMSLQFAYASFNLVGGPFSEERASDSSSGVI